MMLRVTAAAAFIGAACASPSIVTTDGDVLVNIDQAGKDLHISKDGITQSWGDLNDAIDTNTRSIGDVDTRASAVEGLLGLSRRQDEASPSLPDLVNTLIEVNQGLKNEMEAIKNATMFSMMQQKTVVLGVYPASVGAGGGDEVTIGGRNFIPGLPGAYKCTWTHTTRRNDVIVVDSEAVAAETANKIVCIAPPWPRVPTQATYIANLTISEFDRPIEYAGVDDHLMSAFFAEGPTMTDFTDSGLEITREQLHATNGRPTFEIEVDDPDGNPDHVQLTITAANSSVITSTSVTRRGSVRTATLVFADGGAHCGSTNVTIFARDSFGLNSTQTFMVYSQCYTHWYTLIRARSTRSDSTYFPRGIRNLPQGWLKNDTGSPTQYGPMSTFTSLRGIRYIKITKLSGRHINQYATFRLNAPLVQDLYTTIMGCGVTEQFTRSPSTTAWTSGGSGRKVAGNLGMYNRYNQLRPLSYFYICGVNAYGDKDHSILAFTEMSGNSNNWGDWWRGTSQRGTMWSMYNDDYTNGHRYNNPGWDTVQSYPGYKAGYYNYGTTLIEVTPDELV